MLIGQIFALGEERIMIINIKHLAVALTAATLAAVGYVPTASAASAAPRTAPDTVTSSCGSAWLKLWGSDGESCYRGNGSLTVKLSGVDRGQVIGAHLVCLSAAPARDNLCHAGPGTFTITPAARIVKITVSAG
jgi:hypothetical protein